MTQGVLGEDLTLRQVRFNRPGTPLVKKRHRCACVKGHGAAYDDPESKKAQKEWADLIAEFWTFPVDSINEFVLEVWAYFPAKHRGKPDWDNVGKLISDAGNGIIWKDDSQVLDGIVHVRRGVLQPRTIVEVRLLDA